MYPLQRRVDRLVQAVEDQDLWRFLSHQRELEPEELDLPHYISHLSALETCVHTPSETSTLLCQLLLLRGAGAAIDDAIILASAHGNGEAYDLISGWEDNGKVDAFRARKLLELSQAEIERHLPHDQEVDYKGDGPRSSLLSVKLEPEEPSLCSSPPPPCSSFLSSSPITKPIFQPTVNSSLPKDRPKFSPITLKPAQPIITSSELKAEPMTLKGSNPVVLKEALRFRERIRNQEPEKSDGDCGILVDNLPSTASADQIRRHFSRNDLVRSVLFLRYGVVTPKRFSAIIHYSIPRQALQATSQFNNTFLDLCRLTVTPVPSDLVLPASPTPSDSPSSSSDSVESSTSPRSPKQTPPKPWASLRSPKKSTFKPWTPDSWSTPPPVFRPQDVRLYVGGLTQIVRKKDLVDLFEPFAGVISKMTLRQNRMNFGFCHFTIQSEAAAKDLISRFNRTLSWENYIRLDYATMQNAQIAPNVQPPHFSPLKTVDDEDEADEGGEDDWADMIPERRESPDAVNDFDDIDTLEGFLMESIEEHSECSNSDSSFDDSGSSMDEVGRLYSTSPHPSSWRSFPCDDPQLAQDLSRTLSLSLSEEDLASIAQLWQPVEAAPSDFDRTLSVALRFGFLAASDAEEASANPPPVQLLGLDSQWRNPERYQMWLDLQRGDIQYVYVVLKALREFSDRNLEFSEVARQTTEELELEEVLMDTA